MVDFRRFITALAVLAVFAGLAAAQGSGGQTQLTCATNVTATPQLRAEGYTEATGDITITCTGGPNTAVGALIPAVNITIFLNTQVTSRLLGSSNQSEALLLIDEPGSNLLAPAVGGNQPFGPLAPQTICPNFSGNPVCSEFVSSVVATSGAFAGSAVNVATNVAQGTTASVNGYNVFQGVVNANSVTWFGVPVLAPGTAGITRTFRFTNIRANASALSGGSAAGATPVIASIAVSNTAALPITNPTPTIGFVQPGLSTAAKSATAIQQCNSGTRLFTNTLTFTELFGTAFKTRVVPTANIVNGGQTYNSPNSGGGNGTQNIPGTVYNSESNFIQPNVSGNGWVAGLADFGTRLKATFNNVPTGMRIFVSVNNVKNGNAGVTALANPFGDTEIVSTAQLVNSETSLDGNATGGFFPSVSASTNATDSGGNNIPAAELAVTNGSATAVWEVVNTNPNQTESFRFGVYTTFTANVSQNSPPAGTATVNMSFAPTPPVFTTSSGSSASGSLNIPRFIQDPNAAKNIFTVNVCRTVLLYPFVTNQSGFDTGLAIANTSTDPFGTAPQAGGCTLNWYSGTASPAPTPTGNIPSGTVYTALASVTVPGFQGYMIAVCQFQYAHGFAFISDLGARNLAMGYLAIVIPDPATAATTATPIR